MTQFSFFLIGIFAFLYSAWGFAFVQCPNSTRFVRLGDTIHQVIQQCGTPQSTLNFTNKVIIWDYVFMQFGGRFRVGFSVWFDNRGVTHIITLQGASKPLVDCPHGRITIGTPPQQVSVACGVPSHIRTMRNLGRERNTIGLIYHPRTYLPQKTFIFEGGLLKKVK